MKSKAFSEILKKLAKQTPEEKLRIAFNLWQFVNDLQTTGKNAKRKTDTTRATA